MKLEVDFGSTQMPRGFDPQLFKACHDKLAAAHEKRAKKRHDQLRKRAREADEAKDYLAQLPEPPKGADEKIRASVEAVASEMPPEFPALAGSNPSVFAPYGFGGSFISRSGVHGFRRTSSPAACSSATSPAGLMDSRHWKSR